MLDDVVAFWASRTADGDWPGMRVPFDREGRPTGTGRNIWCQARQTFMFGALHERIEPRPDWLDLARRGRDLLVHHAYAGGGRWHYLLDRDGNVIDATRSWITDLNAVVGLCQYALASGRDDDAVANVMYRNWQRFFEAHLPQ